MWKNLAQQQEMAPDDCVPYRDDFHDTQAMEDIQAAEPASKSANITHHKGQIHGP